MKVKVIVKLRVALKVRERVKLKVRVKGRGMVTVKPENGVRLRKKRIAFKENIRRLVWVSFWLDTSLRRTPLVKSHKQETRMPKKQVKLAQAIRRQTFSV